MTSGGGGAPPDGPVAFLGDSHLVAGSEAAVALERFVARAVGRVARLVLLGDIFDLWLARPHLHEEQHRRVLAAVASAREQGLAVDYVVGNRDFGVESLSGAPFDRVASVTLEALHAGAAAPSWVAEHGDLVNDADRPYRAWRAFARSAPVLGLFLALPASVGVPLSQRVERRLRTTNMRYKRRFPVEATTRHAQAHFRRTGARFLLLGHFHQELRLAAAPGEVIVLPDWRTVRRHAEWHPSPGGGATVVVVDSW